jgi:hypothetical protein
MTSGTPLPVAGISNNESFTQNQYYWTAFGVRSDNLFNGGLWDAGVFGSASGGFWPTCYGNPLAISSQYPSNGIEYVVGDFNSGGAAQGTYYAKALGLNGTPGTGLMEWDGGADQIVSNGLPVVRATGSNDVLEAWDLWIDNTMNLDIRTSGPRVTASLFVPASYDARPFKTRYDAVAVADGAPNGSFNIATGAGWYGVVAANEDGGSGTYEIRAGSCVAPSSILPLTTQTVSMGENYRYFSQATGHWAGMALRPDPSSAYGLYLYPYLPNTNPWPDCYGPLLAWSPTLGLTGLVVGDFHYNPAATYVARAGFGSGLAGAQMEWDPGPDQVVVGAPPITRNYGVNDLLKVWDVDLIAGQTYTFNFTANSPGATMLLFRNPGAGTYWAGRNLRAFESNSTQVYVAPSTGTYGLVVLNDNGSSGQYTLSVTQGLVATEPAAVMPTALTGLTPNPARVGARLSFTLHQAGEASFEVYDPAGRLVSAIASRAYPAGASTVPFEAVDESGRRLPAGIYLVRMSVDGRAVGQKKLAVVN